MSKNIDIKQLPAFPVNMSGPCPFAAIDSPEGANAEWGGMSLRDYFAAKVISGSMASCWTEDKDMPEVARRAYLLADAMLEARK